jgi:hypothetical protein
LTCPASGTPIWLVVAFGKTFLKVLDALRDIAHELRELAPSEQQNEDQRHNEDVRPTQIHGFLVASLYMLACHGGGKRRGDVMKKNIECAGAWRGRYRYDALMALPRGSLGGTSPVYATSARQRLRPIAPGQRALELAGIINGKRPKGEAEGLSARSGSACIRHSPKSRLKSSLSDHLASVLFRWPTLPRAVAAPHGRQWQVIPMGLGAVVLDPRVERPEDLQQFLCQFSQPQGKGGEFQHFQHPMRYLK